MVHLLERCRDVSLPVAPPGAGGPLEGAVEVVGVSVLVEVDHRERAEVDGVRTGDPRPVVVVGVEHLRGHGLPAPGGAAVEETRPPLPDPAVAAFDLGNEFVGDGVAVRAEVLGVHRVGVVVVGVRVLDLHHQHPGEVVARPVLVELPGVFLLDPVVAVEVEPRRVLALQVGLRRLLPPAPEGVGEVAVVDGDRITRVGVVIETVRDEHPGPEFGGRAPELGEEVALDLHVLHVLRLRGHRQRGDLLVEHDVDRGGAARAERDRLRGGVEVAGLAVPHLPLAPVRRQLHDVAVGALVGLVAVQERLHPVLASGDVGQAADRVPEGPTVHGDRLAGRPAVDVHAERQLAVRAVHDLEARLRGVVPGEHEDEPAVERLGAPVGRERHRERGAAGARAAESGQRDDENERPDRGEWLADAHGAPPPPGRPV